MCALNISSDSDSSKVDVYETLNLLEQNKEVLKEKFIEISSNKGAAEIFLSSIYEKKFIIPLSKDQDWSIQLSKFARNYASKELTDDQFQILNLLKAEHRREFNDNPVFSKTSSRVNEILENPLIWDEKRIIKELVKTFTPARKREFKDESEKIGEFSNALCIFYDKHRDHFPKDLQKVLDSFDFKAVSTEADIPAPVIDLKKTFKRQVALVA